MKKIIYEAYLNEIANDQFGILISNKKRSKYNNSFYFKNYKITNFNTKKYLLFFSLSNFYKYIWLISTIYFTSQFFISMFFQYKKRNRLFESIIFIDSKKSIYDIGLVTKDNALYLKKNLYSFSCCLSIYDKFKAYTTVYKVLLTILSAKKKLSKIEYNSLKLHIYDLYLLSLFSFILKRRSRVFYTNSHYDRWCYVASKLKNIKLRIVQHGFLTKEILFPFKFGEVNYLYIYENSFVDFFKYHYTKIHNTAIIKPNLELETIQNDFKHTVFIISSMISVELEKKIIDWLLRNTKYKVFVKLHPAYSYKETFSEYENQIEFIHYLVKADFIVTYNSFLGYEYNAMGEKVIWIEKYKNNLNDLYKELESPK